MKNATAAVRKLRTLMKSAGSSTTEDLPVRDDPLGVLVHSFLLWETTSDKAGNAYRKLDEATVDYNDLRVSMAGETVEIIGERYPMAEDRAHRLRATLRDVYLREHAMSLARLEGTGKREVKKYLESLDGIVPYVASRVALVCFGAHAIPVDERLRGRLIEEEIIEEEMDVIEVASWLTRHVKASEALQSHLDLQAVVDSTPARRRKPATNGKTTTKKKTTEKKTPRASSTKKTDAGTSKKKTTSRKTAGRA